MSDDWKARAEAAEAELERRRVVLSDIARYVMTHQDAIRDGNGMMQLARMLDVALIAWASGGKEQAA